MKKNESENELLPGTYTNDFGVIAIVVLNEGAVVSTEGATS